MIHNNTIGVNVPVSNMLLKNIQNILPQSEQ